MGSGEVRAFMEQLERELAEANKERDDALAILGVYKLGCDKQKERIRRLQDAGEAMFKAAIPFPLDEIENISDVGDEMTPMRDVPAHVTIYYDDGPTAGDHSALSEAIAAWTQAKESKP
jgi:hypothetical protein